MCHLDTSLLGTELPVPALRPCSLVALSPPQLKLPRRTASGLVP